MTRSVSASEPAATDGTLARVVRTSGVVSGMGSALLQRVLVVARQRVGVVRRRLGAGEERVLLVGDGVGLDAPEALFLLGVDLGLDLVDCIVGALLGGHVVGS